MLNSAPIYTDLHSLTALRAQASRDPSMATREVAQQFESIFLQMMLKSMRDAGKSMESGLFDSNAIDSYNQLFDKQLSLDIATRGGIGLADILVEQLDSKVSQRAGEASGTDTAFREIQTLTSATPAFMPFQASKLDSVKPEPTNAITAPAQEPKIDLAHPACIAPVPTEATLPMSNVEPLSAKAEPWKPESSQEFVQELLGYARDAAQALGVQPLVLVAQAALETGWGKKVISHADGSSSFNLFNIKANANWKGERVAVNTLEYRDGIAAKEKASFRSYDSLKESFQDYVSLLKNNPRYEEALTVAHDPELFLKALQKAGYATDPNYANKILGIMERNSSSLNESALKKTDIESISG